MNSRNQNMCVMFFHQPRAHNPQSVAALKVAQAINLAVDQAAAHIISCYNLSYSMVSSKAITVEQYLGELPDDRREAISTVRQIILDNLPSGYEEVMNWGMITYQIPLSRYPITYNKQPLAYAALASQKNSMSVYLLGVYTTEENANTFKAEYLATGKKLDMGKSCVRFKKLDDLPLDLIGKTIAKISPEQFIKIYEDSRNLNKN